MHRKEQMDCEVCDAHIGRQRESKEREIEGGGGKGQYMYGCICPLLEYVSSACVCMCMIVNENERNGQRMGKGCQRSVCEKKVEKYSKIVKKMER